VSKSCEKLSPIIPCNDSQNLKSYLTSLYPIYKENIADGNFMFHGKPIHFFTELNHNLQHQSFEHLTTKGSYDRLFNIKRCERILWIRDILSSICNHCTDLRIFRDSKWKPGKDVKRYIIWCIKEDYAIVLEERQKYVMLITAYCVLYPNKRDEFEREYQKSQKNKNVG